MAFLAIHVGFHTAAISHLDVGNASAHLGDFNTKFVPGDTGVAIEWHLAKVAAVITATNSNAVNLEQHLAWTGLWWFRSVYEFEILGLFQKYGFHLISS